MKDKSPQILPEPKRSTLGGLIQECGTEEHFPLDPRNALEANEEEEPQELDGGDEDDEEAAGRGGRASVPRRSEGPRPGIPPIAVEALHPEEGFGSWCNDSSNHNAKSFENTRSTF